MDKVTDNLSSLIGNTPLLRVQKLAAESGSVIWLKLESFNPLSSIKDRTALYMIKEAEAAGKLKTNGTLIEPSSGNTGIALSYLAANKGYKVIIVMPESASEERKKIIKFLGAQLVLTPAKDGMQGAINKANNLVKGTKNSLMLDQFNNPANSKAHYETTGPELWQQTAGKIDVLVAGVGTGGTITGAGSYLKKKNPDIKIIAVEPEESAVLSGKDKGMHKIEGIGAGFIPSILKVDLIDKIITIKSSQAKETAKKLAQEEGIFAGISSGAALAASLEAAQSKEAAGKNIVVILPDSAERYISGWLFEK
jgi:cysteine synthase A